MKRDLTIALLVALIAIAWLTQRTANAPDGATGVSGTGLLNNAPEEFLRITGPPSLQFPEDHALHPGYRNEWWYFTGNLEDEDGARYGFQYTLFRFALPAEAPRAGDFATDAIWMAHLAVSDIEGERFLSRERFARDALGMAGATADQWWLRDWRVERGAAGWRLTAGFDQAALELTLAPTRPPVLQGDAGYSRKGPEPGNASAYYSITRMQARGALTLDGRTRSVSGLAWLDREWGSSQLGEGIAGWDWFALQLADGRDLMLYRLRTAAGAASPFSAGALVEPGGEYRILKRDDFELTPTRTWRDAAGVEWPVAWRVRVPEAGLDVRVEATFDAQRWRGTVSYWEGAVDVFDAGGDRAGRGYLELSGYADTPGGRG